MWWIPLTLIAYALLFVFAFPTWWFYAWFVLGLLIGFNLLLVDRLIYAFWLYPEKPESVQWLEWWRTKNYRALLTNVVQGAPTESGLLTRSPLFLAVFVASSSRCEA